MKKVLFLVTIGLAIGFFAPVKAQMNIDSESFVDKGFSPYMADLAILQEQKHEGDPIVTPDKAKVAVKHIFLWGDIAIPTQEFGYTQISPKD